MPGQLLITAEGINTLNFVTAPSLSFENNSAQISQIEQGGMHFAYITRQGIRDGSTGKTYTPRPLGMPEVTISVPKDTELVLTFRDVARVNFIEVSAIIAALNSVNSKFYVTKSDLTIHDASFYKSHLYSVDSKVGLGYAMLSDYSRFVAEGASTCIPVAPRPHSIISLLGHSSVDLEVPGQFPELIVVSNKHNYSNALNTIPLE